MPVIVPTPHPRRRRRALALATSFMLLVLGAVLPTASVAAEAVPAGAVLDAITGVVMTSTSDPLTVGSKVQMAVTWRLPDGAQPGDTFGLRTADTPRIDGYSSTFTLQDQDGEAVGTCVVNADEFVCTLNDYVLTHTGVQGWLTYSAVLKEATDEGTVQFEVSGGTTIWDVDLPGDNGIRPGGRPAPAPTAPVKGGYINANGNLLWQAFIPGNLLDTQGGAPMVMTDTYDPRLTFLPRTLRVIAYDVEEWNAGERNQHVLPLSAFTVTDDPASSSFQLVLHDPVTDGSVLYWIYYVMQFPSDVQVGDQFDNVIAGEGGWDASAEVSYAEAGGGAVGNALRSLELTKRVQGEDVPAGATYTFSVRCTDDKDATLPGFPQNLKLRAEETVTLTDLRVGTQCVFEEIDGGGAETVELTPSSRIEVTTSSPQVIEMVATNTFVAPPVPTRSIELTKRVEGEGVPAGATFDFIVTCEDGDDRMLPGFPREVTLAADGSVTMDQLPVGSRCAVEETDAAGADSVRYEPSSTVEVSDASPEVIEVVATNTFVAPPVPTRSIELTKRVEGEGIPAGVEFGFSVVCTDQAGDVLAGFPQDVRVVADGSVTVSDVPVGSSCAVQETDAAGADSVRYEPSSTVEVSDASPEVIEVVATNTFVAPPVPTRSIELTKRVEGEGIPAGVEFGFSVVCTDQAGEELPGFPYDLGLRADDTAVIDQVPVGSTCIFAETEAFGAESVRFEPSAQVQVTDEGAAAVQVVATNTFAVPVEPPPTDPPTPTDPAPTDPVTPSTPGGEQPPAAGAGSGSDVLAITGGEVLPLVGFVTALLATGTVLLARSRRRSHQG